MRRKLAALPALAFILLLAGCQDLFTTSLGEWAKRESVTIPANISTDDATAILESSSTSQAAYTSLLDVLNAQAAASGATAEVKVLAVEAALGASGVTASVTETLTSAISDPDAFSDPEQLATTVSSLVEALQTGAEVGTQVGDNGGVVSALLNLGDGETLAAATESMSPSELVVAALILAADGLSAVSPEETNPENLSGDDLTAYQATEQVQVAQSLLEAAVTQLTAEGSESSTALAEQLASLLSMGSTP